MAVVAVVTVPPFVGTVRLLDSGNWCGLARFVKPAGKDDGVVIISPHYMICDYWICSCYVLLQLG